MNGQNANGQHLNKVFVGNLDFGASENDLRDFAEAEGVDVVRVEVMKDRETGRPRGFGFVTIGPGSTVESAVEKLNGMELKGRRLTVNRAAPKQAKTAMTA